MSFICLSCDGILRLWYELAIQYNESDECWFFGVLSDINNEIHVIVY